MRQDVCNNGRHGLTWEQLVAAEPRLASLLEEVRAARLDDGDEFDLEGVWGRFKDRIAGLVGWHRRQGEPLLQTEAAYRTAINWGWKQSRSGIESLPGSRPNSPQPRYPDRELGRLAPHRAACSIVTNKPVILDSSQPRKDPARPSRNRMTARVNDERRNFGASYNFRVHQALGNLRTPRRF